MKQLLLIACLFIAGTSTVNAQSAATTLTGAVKQADTIITSSSVDTVDMYSPITTSNGSKYFLGSGGTWSTQLTQEKIDGTTNATAVLQTTTNGVDWNNMQMADSAITFTNSAGRISTQKHISGKKIVRARWRVFAPSSTQTTKVDVVWLKD